MNHASEVEEQALRGHLKLSKIARREMFDREAARGNDNTLWKTMESVISQFGARYAQPTQFSIGYYEVHLHDLWYMFIASSQHIDDDHAGQDRLIRDSAGRHGRIWTDLPFLIEDVHDAWKKAVKEAPTCQQCARQCRNLTSAVARLVSVGLCVAGLGQCGLEH
ncbi:uncharacterized protein PG998_012838 [Apiospora kogelbergensis]|uniref:uncharacterized protein n=1 Tax=Apiospora kogelbergensis TaxID=1337665 RepID=UPI00312FA41E